MGIQSNQTPIFLSKNFVFIAVILLLAACSKTPEEEVDDAILSANIALTQGKCEDALTVLNEVGMQNKHAEYLRTLASAYACKGGFKETVFFASDLPKTADKTPLGGMATYSTSDDMDDPLNSKYVNLQTGIDTLLYAGGITLPSVTGRSEYFSSAEAGDINAQLLYMVMAQLGRYFYYYGRGTPTGIKGGCFVTYENIALNGATDLDTILSTTGGNCTGATVTGHSKLGSGLDDSLNIARMCQGVVLVNNLLDVIPGVLSSMDSTDFSVASNVTTVTAAINTLLTAATTGLVDMTDILKVKSQSRCETDNASSDQAIQLYFAYYMEGLFQ